METMINLKLDRARLSDKTLEENRGKACDIVTELFKNQEDFTGWVNRPIEIDEEEVKDMIETAKKVQSMSSAMIVIGIGGSYLGTAAIRDALAENLDGIDLYFAGNNLSGTYLSRILEVIDNNEVSVCVVSKSGTTMETLIAWSIIREKMQKKYGKDFADRIIAITDPEKGKLREEATAEGYKTYVIPGNIGGRYSAFTAGILFPLAVAGVDIQALIDGAAALAAPEFWTEKNGIDYALARYALYTSGKEIEAYEFYEPSLRNIGEWLKQLFAESEGKEGQGLFPATLFFSTDLHSIGQFLQEGHQIFFETVVNVLNGAKDIVVPESAGKPLAGKSMNEVNQVAVQGVMEAHSKADVPIIQIEVDRIDEYTLGQLLYYMMMSAAVTGKLMEIDPFNQPGVEAYKSEMRALLNK